MLRGVVGGGARVYLLCPHHAARVLQWLQWWLRGEEEGSRLLLMKPCKCKNAASLQGFSGSGRATTCGNAAKLKRSATCVIARRVSHKTDARDDP